FRRVLFRSVVLLDEVAGAFWAPHVPADGLGLVDHSCSSSWLRLCITWCGFGPVVSGYSGSGSADRCVLGALRRAAVVGRHLGSCPELAPASGAPSERPACAVRPGTDHLGRRLLAAGELVPRDNVLGRTAVQVTGDLTSGDAGTGVAADHPTPCNLGRLTGQYPLKTTARGQFGLPSQPGDLRVHPALVATSGRPNS